MHRATVAVYDERGRSWAARRRPIRRSEALEFGRSVDKGALRADLGCGGGRYLNELGHPVVGIDASRAMLSMCRDRAPRAMLVRGDLEALPFGRGTLSAGWANMSYLHVGRLDLPTALADLHRAMVVGAPVDIQVMAGDFEGDDLPDDDVGGRFFCAWTPQALRDVLVGAGFTDLELTTSADVLRARARRARTLADTVGGGMRLLFVGLNPSLFAADSGVAFARPGNRFWPAAIAAGIVTKDRDPLRALKTDRVGMTDLVKRATPRAAELKASEYRDGLSRVERLVEWTRPSAVCFVGMSGWREVVDQGAEPGEQERTMGGRPVYVMPSTSGANAHARMDDLIAHLSSAAALADQS